MIIKGKFFRFPRSRFATRIVFIIFFLVFFQTIILLKTKPSINKENIKSNVKEGVDLSYADIDIDNLEDQVLEDLSNGKIPDDSDKDQFREDSNDNDSNIENERENDFRRENDFGRENDIRRENDFRKENDFGRENEIYRGNNNVPVEQQNIDIGDMDPDAAAIDNAEENYEGELPKEQIDYPDIHPPSYPDNHPPSYHDNHPPSYHDNHPPSYHDNRPPSYLDNHPPSYLDNQPPSYPDNQPPSYPDNQPPYYAQPNHNDNNNYPSNNQININNPIPNVEKEEADKAFNKENENQDKPKGWKLDEKWEWCRNISIVYTWVNGSDPHHQEVKSHYNGGIKKADQRDRSMDELRYSLRSLEKNLPWHEGTIYIVSPNQVPYWLNIEHPRIKVIDQADLLPPEANPTFNSFILNFI